MNQRALGRPDVQTTTIFASANPESRIVDLFDPRVIGGECYRTAVWLAGAAVCGREAT